MVSIVVLFLNCLKEKAVRIKTESRGKVASACVGRAGMSPVLLSVLLVLLLPSFS